MEVFGAKSMVVLNGDPIAAFQSPSIDTNDSKGEMRRCILLSGAAAHYRCTNLHSCCWCYYIAIGIMARGEAAPGKGIYLLLRDRPPNKRASSPAA